VQPIKGSQLAYQVSLLAYWLPRLAYQPRQLAYQEGSKPTTARIADSAAVATFFCPKRDPQVPPFTDFAHPFNREMRSA
jgi:hypothetical protein